MSRPRLERPVYRLTKRPGKRKWYVTWTDLSTKGRRSRYASTGIEVQEPGNPDEEPGSEARAYLAAFADDQDAPSDQPTITELLGKRLAAWKAKRPRTRPALKKMESFHKHLNAFFGHLTAPHARPAKVAEYTAHREQNNHRHGGGRPIAAIRRELEELRSAFIMAAENEWIERAPKVALPEPRPPRDAFMTREQGFHLVGAAKVAHVRLFIQIALSTGQRKGAILGLTWDRVDFERGILDFRNPEEQVNKKRRGVCSVDPRLLTALREAFELARTDHVIEFQGEALADIKKGFAQAALDAGLVRPRKAKGGQVMVPWVTPHVTKHSVISWLAEKWDVEKIADFTSTDEKTVKRIYRKVNPEHLGGLRDTLGGIVFGVAPTPGRNNRKSTKSKKRASISGGR